MTMGATMGWPTTAVLGFFLLTALVVALGTTSTARYEFERNGTRERQRTRAESIAAHPSGSRHASRRPAAPPTRPRGPRRWTSPCVPLRPRPRRPRLVAGRRGGLHVVAGPFADRIDADWAALSAGMPAVSVHGKRTADGSVAQRPSPEEQAWLGELGEQLDRLPASGTSCCRTPTR